MAAQLRVVDETASGRPLRELSIDLRVAREKMTVRELITRRAQAEVRARGTQDDVEKLVALAVKAFRRNAFIVLLDDEQLEDLDDEVVVGEGVKVSFVELVPLVGG